VVCKRQRPDAARHHDDAGVRRLPQQQQAGVGDPQDADDVRVDDPQNRGRADRGRVLRHPAGDARVVHQHVQTTMRGEQVRRRGQARVVCHVQGYAERVHAGGLELRDRVLASGVVAGTDPDAPAESSQLLGDR